MTTPTWCEHCQWIWDDGPQTCPACGRETVDAPDDDLGGVTFENEDDQPVRRPGSGAASLLLAAASAVLLSCTSPTSTPAPTSAPAGPTPVACETTLVAVDDWDPDTGEHRGELWGRIACGDSIRWERLR